MRKENTLKQLCKSTLFYLQNSRNEDGQIKINPTRYSASTGITVEQGALILDILESGSYILINDDDSIEILERGIRMLSAE